MVNYYSDGVLQCFYVRMVCMEYKLFVFLFLIMFYFVIFLKVVYIVLLIYFRLGKYKKKNYY